MGQRKQRTGEEMEALAYIVRDLQHRWTIEFVAHCFERTPKDEWTVRNIETAEHSAFYKVHEKLSYLNVDEVIE
jgi:hypothetical protein